ncbi:hypothetical protein [Thermoflexibacter ruber]|nr:hypothetical protein [Thermoflexibacter ruber]
MRKLVAIFLVFLLIYNMIGHYLVLIYQQKVANMYFSQSLAHDNIPDDDLFIIKVPASLYVPAKNTDFEPISGSFEYKGKFYDMVKRKVENDTLYIYCANNRYKEKIASQIANYVKSYVVDFENDKNNNQNQKLLKSFAKEYLQVSAYHILSIYQRNKTSEKNVILDDSSPAMPLIATPSPPPEV